SLAEAGAFDGIEDSRRSALWEVPAVARDARLPLPFAARHDAPRLAPLQPHETIAWDYPQSFHSTRGHPVPPLRPLLRARGIPDARTVRRLQSGAHVRYA